MADQITQLEDEIEALYNEKRDQIADARNVIDEKDYMYRAGFLEAIRVVGKVIRKIRNPELPKETGEISDILKTGE